MGAIGFAVGIVVIVFSWASLLATFVLPRGRSLFQRFPRRVIRVVHVAFISATRVRRRFADKDAILAAVGPVALLVQLASFLALFLLGFTLVLEPTAGSFGLAVRQAAAGLFTVGLTRVAGPSDDVAVVLAAATGGIAIALQIGYLPAIYQSFARREALVTLMESRAGLPAWGPEVLIRHQLVTSVDALRGFYRDWEMWSADLTESHTTHPVLVLFRSPEPGMSWLLSLLAVLDAAALHLALAPSSAPSEARLCLRMGFTALRRLAWAFSWPFDEDPKPDDPITLDFAGFSAAVAQLVEIGFPVEREADEAWPHFRGWRVNYEAIAYRFADYLVVAPAPWSGDRHHLRTSVELPNRPPHRSPSGTLSDPSRFRRGQ